MHAGVTEETFASLHEGLARYFLAALKNQDSTVGLIKEAREFLKDNHIEGVIKKGNSLEKLSMLPSLMDEGDIEVPLRLVK